MEKWEPIGNISRSGDRRLGLASADYSNGSPYILRIMIKQRSMSGQASHAFYLLQGSLSIASRVLKSLVVADFHSFILQQCLMLSRFWEHRDCRSYPDSVHTPHTLGRYQLSRESATLPGPWTTGLSKCGRKMSQVLNEGPKRKRAGWTSHTWLGAVSV